MLILFLAGPVSLGLVNAEKTMFVDCLRAFQVSVAGANQVLQGDLEHCIEDADWLLRSWCRKEANLEYNHALDDALQSYSNCEFGTP